MKFKPGDKVRRIKDNFKDVVIGGIYTINMYDPVLGVHLEERDPTFWYNDDFFELVEEEKKMDKFWMVWDLNYRTLDEAKKEAKRLAEKYPGEVFHVLECVGAMQTINAEWKECK